MAIPQGYRLLNESDIGKTFGVDLETLVYFDTSVKPYASHPSTPSASQKQYYITLINTENADSYGNSYLAKAWVIRHASTGALVWYIYIRESDETGRSCYTYSASNSKDKWDKEYTTVGNYTISSLDFTSQFINNWLYVKDIVPEEDEEEEETTSDPYTITIKNKSGITLLVEGKYLTKDITILLDKSLFGEESGGESGGTNSWKVEAVSGASYGFALNSAGYYESGNKGNHSTAAVCKVVLNIVTQCNLYVDCINSGEANYDFGILSTLDNTLDTNYTADSTNVQKSFKGSSSSSIQTVNYGSISVGEHFIYVKFRKDSSQSSGNDTLQFTVRLE